MPGVGLEPPDFADKSEVDEVEMPDAVLACRVPVAALDLSVLPPPS